jgi:hypothetical protein
MQSCSEFQTWGECEGGTWPQREVCGDGVDQDCTGEDEPCCNPYPDCFCVPGAVRYCDGPTYCQWGVQYCRDDGMGWTSCDETGSGPPGCPGMAFNTQCCIDEGSCCQDFHDVDMDGDRQESVGACEETLCARCECDEGMTRYCGSWEGWGIQECVEDALGWTWGPCNHNVPPEVCSSSMYYDVSAERCCVDNGFCCADANDIDGDNDYGESQGLCPEPECCL